MVREGRRPAFIMYILHTGAKLVLVEMRKRKLETDAGVSRYLLSGVIITNLANEISHEFEMATGKVEALEVLTFHR